MKSMYKALSLAFAVGFFAQNISAGASQTIYNASNRPIWAGVWISGTAAGSAPSSHAKPRYKQRLEERKEHTFKLPGFRGDYCLWDIQFSFPGEGWYHATMHKDSEKGKEIKRINTQPMKFRCENNTYYIVWTEKEHNVEFFHALAFTDKNAFENAKKSFGVVKL